jgi:RNA polymerase sigma-70 factor (ECF subfamily)
MRIEVRHAVESLPTHFAELVRLVHWDGLTLEEAAQHLGIPASTARGQHQRAKALLRVQLVPTE